MENTIAIQRLTLNVCYKKKSTTVLVSSSIPFLFLFFLFLLEFFFDEKICILQDFYLSKT